mmetsp:Transcript_133736/g.235826  ORF Transcript_133736/g.235826 Transcript_133736/m.235826 type:complete len:263 (+) Transcript_133736:76-864(+)
MTLISAGTTIVTDIGQHVEMFSAHLNAWLPAKVVAIHEGGKNDGQVEVEARVVKTIPIEYQSQSLRLPPLLTATYDGLRRGTGTSRPQTLTDASGRSRSRSPAATTIVTGLGQHVEVFSSHYNNWLPAKVTAIHSNGQVDVEAKVQKSIPRPYQYESLRLPRGPIAAGEMDILWQSGQQIFHDGYQHKRISRNWTVRDLIDNTGGMPMRSVYSLSPLKYRGGLFLSGPSAKLDLDDPANLEKPLSVLGVSEGCRVELLYGYR